MVLRGYLNAWLPIMSKWNGRILFVDGFAGPGQYEGGEDGSPLIALKAFIEHRFKSGIGAEVIFIFIEKSQSRAKHLQEVINSISSSLPKNVGIEVINGTFDGTMTLVLDQLDAAAKQLAPALVMVDPFGVSETPMSVIERILRNPKSEVYASFMYEAMNRFKETPEFEPHLDQLFGTPNWREGIAIENPNMRKDFFYQLYKNQLREAGAKYVTHFELYEGDRLIYAIFFGTQSLLGCDRMKQAIWKVAPFGEFAFRGTRSTQLSLDLATTDFGSLKSVLRNRFRGRGWVSIQDVSDFVASDQTDYHTGQVKRNALIPMEESNEIEVDPDSRKRKRTYPDGTRLRFH